MAVAGGEGCGVKAAVGDAPPINPRARLPSRSPIGGIGIPMMEGGPPAVPAGTGVSAFAAGISAPGGGPAGGTASAAVAAAMPPPGAGGSAGGHLGRYRRHICCRVDSGRMALMNLQMLSATAATQHSRYLSGSDAFAVVLHRTYFVQSLIDICSEDVWRNNRSLCNMLKKKSSTSAWVVYFIAL